MESSVTRLSRSALRVPGSAWVAAGCVLVLNGIAIGLPPTTFVATVATGFAALLAISGAILVARALGALERLAGKRAPVRLLSMFLWSIVHRLCSGNRGFAVEPGLIDLPPCTWLHITADLMLIVPVLVTVADVLGAALRGRGSVATRIAVIATACGVAGIGAAGFVVWVLFSVDAQEFDRMVAGPALGAIVLSATAGIAMRAARIALAEVRERGESRDADPSYRIVRPLAAGGMGEVFLAERVGPHGFHRSVVLKRILAAEEDDPVSVERFLEEARIAASLQHPNIVAVNDLGNLQGNSGAGWFLAMEYLAGLTVREVRALLERHEERCPADSIAAVGLQACRGLAHAHAQGVIHRDVSPHNLMVTFEGIVKVLDFGVAKIRGDSQRVTRARGTGSGSEHPTLTRDGAIVGKVAYLAPELFRGAAASAQADVFALGVSLYELACGTHPYGRQPGRFPVGETAEDRVPLALRRADLGLPLCIAIDRAVAFDPWNRHRSAADLAEALAHAQPDAGRFDLGAWLKSFAPPDADALTPPNGTTTMPFAVRHAPGPAR